MVELGSKYTGSEPSTAFLRRLAKYSRSSLVVFLLWGLEDWGRLSVWFGDWGLGVSMFRRRYLWWCLG